MLRLSQLTTGATPPVKEKVGAAPLLIGGPVRTNLANALIGRTVALLEDANRLTHGVVTGAITEAGVPKLLVHGRSYDLSHVLTAMPTSLNQ